MEPKPSAYNNDTLGGRLEAWVRPEDAPHRGRVGFWRMIEERMIRAQLAEEGWQEKNPDRWIDFEVSRRIIENHKNDASLREIQAALPKAPPPVADWTREELERLVDHFAGANDPIAKSIFEKATQRLSR